MPYKTMITVAAVVGFIFALAFAAAPKFFCFGNISWRGRASFGCGNILSIRYGCYDIYGRLYYVPN